MDQGAHWDPILKQNNAICLTPLGETFFTHERGGGTKIGQTFSCKKNYGTEKFLNSQR